MDKKVKRDTHAGSWYSDKPSVLKDQLNTFLDKAAQVGKQKLKAIVSPHAGYAYCGETAAYGFKSINFEGIKRVFVLGPSHFKYLIGAGITVATAAKTPVGDFEIDTEICTSLKENEFFDYITLKEDEREHSIEMQLPFLRHVSEGVDLKLVLLMVGTLSTNSMKSLTEALLPYFESDENLFVISSDFCHWGDNFSFTPGENETDIDGFIKELDFQGIDYIKKQDLEGFLDYVEDTENTICGRHPIEVMLSLMKHSESKYNVEMLNYSRSGPVSSTYDSSVGYASLTVNKL